MLHVLADRPGGATLIAGATESPLTRPEPANNRSHRVGRVECAEKPIPPFLSPARTAAGPVAPIKLGDRES